MGIVDQKRAAPDTLGASAELCYLCWWSPSLGAREGHIYISVQMTKIPICSHRSTAVPQSVLFHFCVICPSHITSNMLFHIPLFCPSCQTASSIPWTINSAGCCSAQGAVFCSQTYPSLLSQGRTGLFGKWAALFLHVFIQQTLKCLLWTQQGSRPWHEYPWNKLLALSELYSEPHFLSGALRQQFWCTTCKSFKVSGEDDLFQLWAPVSASLIKPSWATERSNDF